MDQVNTAASNSLTQPKINNVLFVDDEPNILSGIRRMLRPLRNAFNVKVAESGEAAIDLMQQEHFDIIVSDMRMPGMSGVELLNKVKKHYPETIRLALSGHAETEMELQCAKAAHQFLQKPIATDALVSTMQAALELKNRLHQDELQKVVSGISSLPSLPSLYQDIHIQAASPTGSIKEIGNIISKDVAMTAKILQLVNSSFFGLGREITSAPQAATILGFDILKSIVLSEGVMTSFDATKERLNLEDLTSHSQKVGVLASKISEVEGCTKKESDMAMMSGMLHDIGKLILSTHLHLDYKNQATEPLWQWEKDQTAITHAEVGAYLLGIWGLPNPIIEAVMYHHRPSECVNQTFSPLTATHVANALVDEFESSSSQTDFKGHLDLNYLENVGKTARFEVWKGIAQETLTN